MRQSILTCHKTQLSHEKVFHEKMRCTVMFGITVHGSKLPPFVIFKEKTVSKGVRFPAGIHG